MIVYIVTNRVNSRQYVGITRCGLADRWRRHVSDTRCRRRKGAFNNAIRKYGAGAFTAKEICCAKNWSDLCWLESHLIVEHGTHSPNGYNMTDGGEGITGYKYPREIVERIAAKNRGNRHTEEAKRLIGLAGIGRKKSKSAKAAIGAAHRGKSLTAEHRAKLSAVKLGKKLPPRSAGHCAKISAGLVAAHARRRKGADA